MPERAPRQYRPLLAHRPDDRLANTAQEIDRPSELAARRRMAAVLVADIACRGRKCPLAGVKRTCRLGLGMSAIGPKADIGFAGELQPQRMLNHPPTQEILKRLLAAKPRKEPHQPRTISYCPLVHH